MRKRNFVSRVIKLRSMPSSERFVIPEGHGHREAQPLHQNRALPESICTLVRHSLRSVNIISSSSFTARNSTSVSVLSPVAQLLLGHQVHLDDPDSTKYRNYHKVLFVSLDDRYTK